MRVLAREVAGRPKEDDAEERPLPEVLGRLHCVPYDSLSPVNRRQCFRLVLRYLGLSEDSGGELLGHDRWQRLMRSIEARCGGLPAPGEGEGDAAPGPAAVEAPAPSPRAPPEAAGPAVDGIATIELDEWSRQALVARLLQLPDADGFDMYGFDRLDSALQNARRHLALPPHAASKTSQYVGLGLLGPSRYAGLDSTVRAGLPRAVLEALALDDDAGPRILGAAGWERVASRYAAGIAEPEAEPEAGPGDDITFVLPAPKRGGPARGPLVLSMVVALVAFIVVLAVATYRLREISTPSFSTRTAPMILPPGDAIPAGPGNDRQAPGEPLQPFVPPAGSDPGDARPRP